jgi:hypothetical protein
MKERKSDLIDSILNDSWHTIWEKIDFNMQSKYSNNGKNTDEQCKLEDEWTAKIPDIDDIFGKLSIDELKSIYDKQMKLFVSVFNPLGSKYLGKLKHKIQYNERNKEK